MRLQPPTPKRSLRERLPVLKPRVLGGSLVIAAAAIGAVAAGRGLAFVPQKAIEGPLTLANFVKGTTDCFDRS
jgi:DNA-binding transcriptional LysR family regulator